LAAQCSDSALRESASKGKAESKNIDFSAFSFVILAADFYTINNPKLSS